METTAKVEVLPYIVLKDGNGFETKVCNFDHPDVCKRKGTITIEAIRRTNRHAPRVSFRRTTDRNTGISYGIPEGIDSDTKAITFRRISLPEMMQYDLSNEHDAKEWAVVKMQPFMVGSPLQSGKPLFRVYDRDEEANKVVEKINAREKATGIVKKLNMMQQIDMVRNMGLAPETNSPVLLLAQLFQLVEKDPTRFLEIFENVNTRTITVINRCKAVGLLKFDNMQGWLWRQGLALGSNDMQIIDYLGKNPQLFVTMDLDSKQMDALYLKHGEAIIEPSHGPKPEGKHDDLAVIQLKADLKKKADEMEAKEKLLDEKMKQMDALINQAKAKKKE